MPSKKRKKVDESEEEELAEPGVDVDEFIANLPEEDEEEEENEAMENGIEAEEGGEEEGDEGDEGDEGLLQETVAQRLGRVQADNYNKAQRIKELENENAEWKTQHEDLSKENKRLLATNAALEREVNALSSGPQNEGRGEEEATTVEDGLHIVSKPMGKERNLSDYVLAMMLPPNHQKHQPPQNYKEQGHLFPHMLGKDKTGARLFVVESRNYVHITCQLRHWAAKRDATESEISSDPSVHFKMEVCYAGTGEPVDKNTLRNKPANLFDPPESELAVCQMNGGKISWRFKVHFLTRHTEPIGRLFMIKVTCTTPSILEDPSVDLSCCSPPFQVISRDLTTRKEKKKNGGGD